jgi:hypothetical protein
MKSYLSLLAVALSSMLISCSEDTNPQPCSSQTAISFAIDGDATTRAASLSTISEFTVYAYDSDGKVVINGAGYYADGTSKDGMTYYWPTSGSLSFYAFTPSGNSNCSISGNVLTYTVPTDNSAQTDLMTATAENQTKSTNNGVVRLNFNHLLSKITFKGYVAMSGLTAEVGRITLHNVNSVMTVWLNGASVSAPTPKDADYSLGLSDSKTVTSADGANPDNLTAEDGAMLLVPQTLTPMTEGKTTAQADAAKECYLEVSCKVKAGSHYLAGSSSEYATKYIPMSCTLEAGKSYVFSLCFDGPIIKIGTGTTIPEQSEAKRLYFE